VPRSKALALYHPGIELNGKYLEAEIGPVSNSGIFEITFNQPLNLPYLKDRKSGINKQVLPTKEHLNIFINESDS
jgi:hypothetical protein